MIVFKNIDILDENFQLKQNVSVRVEGNLIKEISSEPIEQKEADRVLMEKSCFDSWFCKCSCSFTHVTHERIWREYESSGLALQKNLSF